MLYMNQIIYNNKSNRKKKDTINGSKLLYIAFFYVLSVFVYNKACLLFVAYLTNKKQNNNSIMFSFP